MKIVSERVIEMPGRVLAGLLVLWIALSILPSPGVGEESSLFTGFWQSQEPEPDAGARRIVADLDLKPPVLALAAQVSGEGHWTFTNAAGQQFTAANSREMSRVTRMLAPSRAPLSGPLILYIPAQSVITHARHLKLLPARARLRIVTGGTSYPMMMLAAKPDAPAWFAEVSPNVLVRADRVASFDDTVWQLRRSVNPRRIRILSLEPGGPDSLPPRAPVRREGQEPVVEPVNPSSAAGALRALSGQIVVITGRLEGDDRLVYRTANGGEQTLALPALRAAAARADADLVVLTAAAPRQPGARNWLWLRVDVDNLFEAVDRPTLGRFLNALAGDQGRLFVTVRHAGPRRMALSVVPLSHQTTGSEPGTIASLLAEIASEVAGTVMPHAAEVDLVARDRADELAHRLLPGVPSLVQHIYLAAFLPGLVALPVTLAWWRRIWPAERRQDYAGSAGYLAAAAIRWVLFVVLFLPVVGLPALGWAILGGAFRTTGGGRSR
jgi:hypothetical protein